MQVYEAQIVSDDYERISTLGLFRTKEGALNRIKRRVRSSGGVMEPMDYADAWYVYGSVSSCTVQIITHTLED